MTNIRIGTADDIAKISFVLASSWRSAYRGIVNDDYLDTLKDDHWIDSLTAGLNGNVFSMVFENNQEIIGAAILSSTEDEHKANLISFYLLPDKIGQGFGHAFYSAIETELRKRGFQNCVVDAFENNTRAIRFYKAHGFVEIDRTIRKWDLTCKVFEKSIV